MKNTLVKVLIYLLDKLSFSFVYIEDHLHITTIYRDAAEIALKSSTQAAESLASAKAELKNLQFAYDNLAEKYSKDLKSKESLLLSLAHLVSGVERVGERIGPFVELDRAKAEITKHV